MTDSTKKSQRFKPDKPSPDFPLYAHGSGKWAKRVDGKVRYFGSWGDPDSALAAYLEWQDEHNSSKKLPTYSQLAALAPKSITIKEAAALYLADKEKRVARGEITDRTFRESFATCSRLLALFGDDRTIVSLQPADFSRFRDDRAATLNIVSIGNEITRVKTFFKWLHEAKYLKEPMTFGPGFKKPSVRALRKHKRESGKKLYSANEVLRLIHECGTHLRAMVYLGINCGFGPNDCAQLPLTAVNLKTGWLDFPRPKTEVDRLCPLWPETVAALEASLAIRLLDVIQYEKDDTVSSPVPNRFFLYLGKPWNKSDSTQLSKYFTSVRKRILKDGGWYWLRHTFETVAGGSKDQIAVNAIMGHADNSMAAVYREEISPERLRAVTDHVRDWLLSYQ